MAFSKGVAQVKSDNGETLQDAINLKNAVTYKTTLAGSSADPFSGKTNKYAEGPMILVHGAAAFNIKVGGSGISAADGDDQPIPANTLVRISIDDNAPYVRIYGASGDVHVTELGL